LGSLAASTFDLGGIPQARIKSRLGERARTIRELDDIDALVRTHQARILRFVAHSTGDLDLAESITQDTLLRAYNGRDNFRGECSVKTWLTGIALNVTRDHLRTERYKFWRRVKSSAIDIQEMSSFIASEETSPEGKILAREKVEHLHKALAQLSFNQRTVFLMKFSEDMTVNEIGELLQMNVSTVRTHLHRALKAVREKLGAEA
jgi:RNA polymerase sigma-70 factor (ECF subfamily)